MIAGERIKAFFAANDSERGEIDHIPEGRRLSKSRTMAATVLIDHITGKHQPARVVFDSHVYRMHVPFPTKGVAYREADLLDLVRYGAEFIEGEMVFTLGC